MTKKKFKCSKKGHFKRVSLFDVFQHWRGKMSAMNISGKCVNVSEMAINTRHEGRKTSRETTRHVGGIHRYKPRLPKVASIFSAWL